MMQTRRRAHRARVIDAFDGAVHVFGDFREAFDLGAPGNAFFAVRKVHFHDEFGRDVDRNMPSNKAVTLERRKRESLTQ